MDAEAKQRLLDEFRACLDHWDENGGPEGDEAGGEGAEPPARRQEQVAGAVCSRNLVRLATWTNGG